MKPIISVERLSKRYFVGHQLERRPDSFREMLTRHARNVIRRSRDMAAGRAIVDGDEVDEFWALKDVSFEVRPGDVLGVIGRNGAGKSTLLKVLSRITEPTDGRASIRGRVASLLEVGTGFHPELTGRENIFLNGAVLGMSRAEIKRKFDEIVAFAEVERFLDTPVKRFSSGMYVRLAFAVAAHLEPEILVVDEVLSVGDAAFQHKCLGKMDSVSRAGRTVLFVSHHMAAVERLCSSVMVLSQGRVAFQGATNEGISAYLTEALSTPTVPIDARQDRAGSGVLRFRQVCCRSGIAADGVSLMSGHAVVFELHFDNASGQDLRSVAVAMAVDDQYGQRVLYLYSDLVNQDFDRIPSDVSCIDLEIPKLPLSAGRYDFTLFARVNGEVSDWIKNAGSFHVEGGDFYGTGKLPPAEQRAFLVEHTFRLNSAAFGTSVTA